MSSATLTPPAETIQSQRRASNPSSSAWVSANAGSGKTFVLTRRVVRLLLEGVPPSRILCLTFTKAAAANMAIKVFETLAAWVTMDDAKLAAAIADTGAGPPGPADLAKARRLFAQTVESPGGLKILTIHAFCEKLLHGFPFEANVAARFSVIEEVQQAELMSRAREATLARAVDQPESGLGHAVEALGRTLSAGVFEDLIGEVTRHADVLRVSLRRTGGLEAFGRKLAQVLDTGGLSVAAVERAMLEDGFPGSEWDRIGRHLIERGKGSPVGTGLIQAAQAREAARLAAYLQIFLTKDLRPRKSLASQKLRAAEPALCASLDAEGERLTGLLGKRRAAEAFERTMALLTVGDAVVATYEAIKRSRGYLDFGDLIERSRMLLSRSDAAWVLYKLDSGIDHVLVDEAQDTSPEQWEILRAISRDFFAGEGQSRATRTFFAVGDEKQSIYSFQGARPAMFDTTRRDYAKQAADAALAFADVKLLLSFRSARTVLDVVDRIFAHGDNGRGLTAGDKPPPHQAMKADLPGLVEIWPLVGPLPSPEPSDWRLPVDLPDASDPPVILARRIADTIRNLVAPSSAETVEESSTRQRRPVRPGDILILVRSRNAFFNAVIRALKERHVPVAGADRISLTDHIPAMDLMAAGRAALLPDDDLTLACVLKSPLIGLDDDDLIRLAPGRRGSLAAALDASSEPRHRAAAQTLAIWRDRAATLTPFAFYTRLLGLDRGRRSLLARLGPESGDVIDEFMALTLAHERDGAPSLLAFLARLEDTELSIKRDMEQAGDAVRVMTVHAAKGLEAKIVFLPDTCSVPTGQHDPKLFRLDQPDETPLLVWSPKADTDPPAVAASRAAGRDAALDEHRRLLYVALTRAEERLYISGHHGKRGPQAGCWYAMIEGVDLGLQTIAAPWDPNATIQRRADPVPVATPLQPSPIAARAPLPDWITRSAPRETPLAPPIRPSNVLGAADRMDAVDAEPDDGRRGAGRREAALGGRLMHRLLQHLPALAPVRRRDAAARFLAAQGRALSPERRDGLIDDALRLLDDPSLAPLFGPGSRAEVALAATIHSPAGPPIDVTGQLDRIGVTAEAVHIADYKTGRPRGADEAPPSYVAQLALYRAAVQLLYPDLPVRAFLIWTDGPVVTEIAADALDGVMESIRQDQD